jgi:hypothetical protein
MDTGSSKLDGSESRQVESELNADFESRPPFYCRLRNSQATPTEPATERPAYNLLRLLPRIDSECSLVFARWHGTDIFWAGRECIALHHDGDHAGICSRLVLFA